MTRVLLIEDDPDVATLVAVSLESAGIDFISIDDGAAGLDEAVTTRPDLIILDWMLPSLDGLEVCRALRTDDGLVGVPIVMLTAKAMARDVERAVEAGATDYIFKPFSPRELTTRVHALLAKTETAK